MRATALTAALIAAALLAGCSRSQDATAAKPTEPAAAPAAAAPPASADFDRPLNALGTEPFWSLKIRTEGLSFSTPDAAETPVANPGPDITGDTAVWKAVGADGKPLVATLKRAPCSDGMSDAAHPFTTVVEAGGRTLKGCAAYAEAAPAAP